MFRDDYERRAHDIICIVKHGSIGGQVAAADVKRVADYLRDHASQTVRITLPANQTHVRLAVPPPLPLPPVFKLPT